MQLYVAGSAVTMLLLAPAAATTQSAPQTGGSAAAQVVQAVGELGVARKCGWSTPLALTAMESTLEIARADLTATAPADAKAQFEAAVANARTRAAGMDCTAAQASRATVERRISGQLDQMLIQTDFFSSPPANAIIELSVAAGREVALAASWIEGAVAAAQFKTFATPLYERAQKVAMVICADRKAQGRPLDVYMCKTAPAADPAQIPTARIAAKAYKAFGEALAADQRAKRVALERQAGKLSAFYKTGVRPSDCRAGDTVFDYGSAKKRIAGASPAELSLVRRLKLGSPNTAAPGLYLRMPDLDNKLPPNPEHVELFAVASDAGTGGTLATSAVSGVFQYTPDAIAQAKQSGLTDAQLAARSKAAADDTFSNYVAKGAMGATTATGYWRCPSGS